MDDLMDMMVADASASDISDKIKEIDKEIKKEIKDGTLVDPNAMVDPNTGAPLDPNMDLGQPITEPDLESQGSATEAPEGGEI